MDLTEFLLLAFLAGMVNIGFNPFFKFSVYQIIPKPFISPTSKSAFYVPHDIIEEENSIHSFRFILFCCAMGWAFFRGAVPTIIWVVSSFVKSFEQQVDVVLERLSEMVEMLAECIKNERKDGGESFAEMPVVVKMAYYFTNLIIYLVDTILGWSGIDGEKEATEEIPVNQTKTRPTIDDLLKEWEREDRSHAYQNQTHEKDIVKEADAIKGAKEDEIDKVSPTIEAVGQTSENRSKDGNGSLVSRTLVESYRDRFLC